MKNPGIKIGDTDFDLVKMTRQDTSQSTLDESAAALFRLFLCRETAFGFNPQIVIDYPSIEDATTSPFLTTSIEYVDALITRLNLDGAAPIGRVVVLTTFGDRLYPHLCAAGFAATEIVMPAGPDSTASFKRNVAGVVGGRTLYLEAVNEADEKIRPAFAIELRDDDRRLRGGACGSLCDIDGRRFAYLATMTLDVGLPATTGTALTTALLAFLGSLGVSTIHLGTQTAGPFYEKAGFRIVHTVLRQLRCRAGDDDKPVFTDLVMMQRDLTG